ncbi:MAG: hypothetical protein JSU94_12205 [Phycisphaerales bacterium]|nr:MAG: hypothetical protein JSU94_12205 [Phycisphaerales bacterium]
MSTRVGDVLSELDDMIGWDDRFLITFDALDWDDAGILSGMRIPSQGKEIYRYTPSNKSSPISNSPATWYIADQNVTPVANGSIYTPSGGSISDAGSWIVVQFVFSVQDNSGLTVAYFDDSGNVVLKGDLEEGEGSGPSGTYGAGLKVKDSTNDLMIIDATTGNMFIRGQLYEEQSSLSPSQQVDEFIMKDGDGTVVAYLDPSGNLYLSGVLYEDMNP